VVAVPGATGYLLSRAMTSNGAPPAILTTSSTAYSDNSVTNGTTYWYAVSATNSDDVGINSAWIAATPTAPSPVFLPGSGVSMDPATGQAVLTFTTTDGYQYRILYRTICCQRTAGKPVKPPEDGWHTATNNEPMTVTDQGATNSPQRFYRIEAK